MFARRLFLILLVLAALIGPIYLRTIYESFLSLQRAREASLAERYPEAIEQYRLSLSWRSPFNPFSQHALGDFHNLAQIRLNESEFQVEALREFRSAVLASRSFWNYSSDGSHRDELVADLILQAEKRLAELTGEQDPSLWKVRERNQYREDFRFQLFSQLFFWIWILAVLAFLWRGFDADGKLLKQGLLVRSSIVAISYCAWLYCLSMA